MTLDLHVSFDSPTFTHGANQGTVEARPSEFKAELRRWWRILKASDGLDVEGMHREEQALFGGTGRSHNEKPSISKVRFRSLSCPEATTTTVKAAFAVGGQQRALPDEIFYLAYGITENARDFKESQCLFTKSQDGDPWSLRLGFHSKGDAGSNEEKQKAEVVSALRLMDMFGCIGGRSNNGWGSLSIKARDGGLALPDALPQVAMPIAECLQKDWPHALGAGPIANGPDGNRVLAWKLQADKPLLGVFTALKELREQLNREGKIDATNGVAKRGATQIFFKVKRRSDSLFTGMAYCLPHSFEQNSQGSKMCIEKWTKHLDNDSGWARYNPFTMNGGRQ